MVLENEQLVTVVNDHGDLIETILQRLQAFLDEMLVLGFIGMVQQLEHVENLKILEQDVQRLGLTHLARLLRHLRMLIQQSKMPLENDARKSLFEALSVIRSHVELFQAYFDMITTSAAITPDRDRFVETDTQLSDVQDAWFLPLHLAITEITTEHVMHEVLGWSRTLQKFAVMTIRLKRLLYLEGSDSLLEGISSLFTNSRVNLLEAARHEWFIHSIAVTTAKNEEGILIEDFVQLKSVIGTTIELGPEKCLNFHELEEILVQHQRDSGKIADLGSFNPTQLTKIDLATGTVYLADGTSLAFKEAHSGYKRLVFLPILSHQYQDNCQVWWMRFPSEERERILGVFTKMGTQNSYIPMIPTPHHDVIVQYLLDRLNSYLGDSSRFGPTDRFLAALQEPILRSMSDGPRQGFGKFTSEMMELLVKHVEPLLSEEEVKTLDPWYWHVLVELIDAHFKQQGILPHQAFLEELKDIISEIGEMVAASDWPSMLAYYISIHRLFSWGMILDPAVSYRKPVLKKEEHPIVARAVRDLHQLFKKKLKTPEVTKTLPAPNAFLREFRYFLNDLSSEETELLAQLRIISMLCVIPSLYQQNSYRHTLVRKTFEALDGGTIALQYINTMKLEYLWNFHVGQRSFLDFL